MNGRALSSGLLAILHLIIWTSPLLPDDPAEPRGFARDERRRTWLVGYTQGRVDLPSGQFENWTTNRAMIVRANGEKPRTIGKDLIQKRFQWTQFAGWSPDGAMAVVGCHWESPENAAWERANRTFRMTEGWLSDICLVNLSDGRVTNLTEVERVSNYNTGLFFLPDGAGFGFTPLIDGVSKPFLMDLDGRNKRDVSGGGKGFAYGFTVSPRGNAVAYHEDYKLCISAPDGSRKIAVETGNRFNFAPRWSPGGDWLLFVSGEHYNCHPHLVRPDGSGLRKLADRGGYRGVVEMLDHPDFHSQSSDLPVWSPDGRWVYFVGQADRADELFRVALDGKVDRLTRSPPGVRHCHPAVSPDGEFVLFGSDRTGAMQLYVAKADGTAVRPITDVPRGFAAMHGHWRPVPASDDDSL